MDESEGTGVDFQMADGGEGTIEEEAILMGKDGRQYIDEVEVCVLSENSFVDMPVNPWDIFGRLWKLDLSRNKLRSLQGFRSLSVIGCLNLSRNHLDFSAIADLRNTIILNLEVEDNPLISRHAQNRAFLCALLPRLWCLNSMYISTKERKDAKEHFDSVEGKNSVIYKGYCALLDVALMDNQSLPKCSSRGIEIFRKFSSESTISAYADVRRLKFLLSDYADILETENDFLNVDYRTVSRAPVWNLPSRIHMELLSTLPNDILLQIADLCFSMVYFSIPSDCIDESLFRAFEEFSNRKIMMKDFQLYPPYVLVGHSVKLWEIVNRRGGLVHMTRMFDSKREVDMARMQQSVFARTLKRMKDSTVSFHKEINLRKLGFMIRYCKEESPYLLQPWKERAHEKMNVLALSSDSLLRLSPSYVPSPQESTRRFHTRIPVPNEIVRTGVSQASMKDGSEWDDYQSKKTTIRGKDGKMLHLVEDRVRMYISESTLLLERGGIVELDGLFWSQHDQMWVDASKIPSKRRLSKSFMEDEEFEVSPGGSKRPKQSSKKKQMKPELVGFIDVAPWESQADDSDGMAGDKTPTNVVKSEAKRAYIQHTIDRKTPEVFQDDGDDGDDDDGQDGKALTTKKVEEIHLEASLDENMKKTHAAKKPERMIEPVMMPDESKIHGDGKGQRQLLQTEVDVKDDDGEEFFDTPAPEFVNERESIESRSLEYFAPDTPISGFRSNEDLDDRFGKSGKMLYSTPGIHSRQHDAVGDDAHPTLDDIQWPEAFDRPAVPTRTLIDLSGTLSCPDFEAGRAGSMHWYYLLKEKPAILVPDPDLGDRIAFPRPITSPRKRTERRGLMGPSSLSTSPSVPSSPHASAAASMSSRQIQESPFSKSGRKVLSATRRKRREQQRMRSSLRVSSIKQ
eukprot:TRINITY_DN7263_c0_g1_i2.p1 TRINITY_DN7263_c0_g1~~TRINITY_DN7263_c0_g1_i2.p1  ORF type:complete len:909 (-),score=253.67 TRINITY_DN7263_c0_g1_i2:88-2814(-)